ncbi:MAG TPA: type I methionyl aminopeptidase [Candidatus Paceibacterota bacterium]|nr:type I methionyl aminopeptidase [Candidatus Paceibacterota bacterium]
MAKIKTKEEIAILTEAGRRLAVILDTIGKEARAGVAVQELDRRAHELITAGHDAPSFLDYKPAGAKRPFPASLCVSVNDAAVHGIPTESEYMLVDGDIVSLDAGLTHQGLIADMCITVPVGEVDARGMRLIDAARRARDAGVLVCRAGAHLGDIGAAIERSLAGTGFTVVEDLGGHGVGHKVHESPHVFHFGTRDTGPVLEEGMVITIEPTVSEGGTEIVLDPDGYTYRTKDHSRTAQFEHTIVITKDGHTVITKA